MKDYEASVAEFPEDKKIEFIEHLLECLDIIDTYISNPSKENWDVYAKKETDFLKKHGKRLAVYRQKKMHLYYGNNVLVEKDIYTIEEWNALSPEKQTLSPKELSSFVYLCRNSLCNERDYLLLAQSPADEKEEGKASAASIEISRKGRIKREAHDKLTALSQEQTVLLMFYLQQEKVFLRGEYLTDMDAGKAFEILTGYSQHTLRQNLSKALLYQNKTNLKEIDHLLNRMRIAVDKALKEK